MAVHAQVHCAGLSVDRCVAGIGTTRRSLPCISFTAAPALLLLGARASSPPVLLLAQAADLSLACETSMLALLPDTVRPDLEGKYPRVAAWMQGVQGVGGGKPWAEVHAVLNKVVAARRAKL